MILSGPHDEFLELCALSVSGQLSHEDQERLREHLAVCPSCREALQQYELILDQTIPALGAECASEVDPGPFWSQTKAERMFFERLGLEERKTGGPKASRYAWPLSLSGVLPTSESTWRHIWMLSAAGLMLFLTLGYGAYWMGARKGVGELATSSPQNTNAAKHADGDQIAALSSQLSDASQERELARRDFERGTHELAQLRAKLIEQRAEIAQLHGVISGLQASVADRDDSIKQFVTKKGDLELQLKGAERNGQLLQAKYDALASSTNSAALRAAALEGKVNELTKQLEQRDQALSERDQLLEHDRDIRELMGARDLYIAEVYDVADTGATKKPYGRVFYTKGRSLIFYAYDLEDSAVRRDVTFQAWGRRGPDRLRAVNLGIFYEDNAAKKRWVLKLDDPKTLREIDAVFVTVEHDGRKEKPSGKPLLFAYLKVDPNHP